MKKIRTKLEKLADFQYFELKFFANILIFIILMDSGIKNGVIGGHGEI